MFDVVMPVNNNLHQLRPCLESLEKSLPKNSKLFIIDDFSDSYVSKEIELICKEFSVDTVYFRNKKNIGYLKSCNHGITLGNNPFVVLVNSDTLVFKESFKILKDTFDRFPDVGIINPVSNWANWTRIPFPDGFNINELNDYISNFTSSELVADINNASGFFMAVRRELFDKYGLFDEIYSPGYYEETDFCMRILEQGHRVVVHKGLFIFHQGWGSFGEESRNFLMNKNKSQFLSKWGGKFHYLEEEWKKNDPIRDLKEDLVNAVPAKNLSKIKVIYVLQELGLFGGVISVIQLVNQLNLMGISANIATYGKINENFISEYPLYFRPYIFDSEVDLVANFPECEIAVATAWSTVYPLLELNKNRDLKLLYFVQDFEPDFHDPDSEEYKKAYATYDFIHTKIVKSRWLKERLKYFEGDVHQIPLGLDSDIFYNKNIDRTVHVISHARPNTPRRNFPMLKEVFKRLKEEDDSIILGVYGTHYSPNDFEVPIHDFGVLNDAKDVSDALNQSLVLIDVSKYQGFGRPGLEAMACSTATVLTRNGGITEYAKHKYNTLLVNPFNPEEIVQNIMNLLQNKKLRKKLIEKGLETSKDYSLKNEAQLTKELIESML